MLSVQEQLEVIEQGTVEIVPREALREKLQCSVDKGEPLTVKQGYDPTAPDIHLGHVVCLRKLRQFQDLGHKVIFLIGDFTGLIGDPSGRSEMRKRMSKEELLDNAATYREQVVKLLDPDKTIFEFNSKWLGKLAFEDVLDLAATQTVARLLERDDFSARFNANRPISLLEFLYPLAQGYDSVALRADIELGATEQKFNLLMAREIQKAYGQEPQVIITMPILEGTDGVEKMSKSFGNYIGITEPPEEIFGKAMSIPDGLILRYFELVSTKSPTELKNIARRLQAPETNPVHLKRELARDLVCQFYDPEAARRAEAHFDTIHVKRDVPEEVHSVELEGEKDGLWIVKALTGAGLCKSSSEARRMIEQGAVTIDGERVSDVELRLPRSKKKIVIKVGKRRFIALVVK